MEQEQVMGSSNLATATWVCTTRPTDIAEKTSICGKQDTDRNTWQSGSPPSHRSDGREVSEKPWKNSHCCLCLLEVVEQRSNPTYNLCFLDFCYSFYVWSEVLVMHFWSNWKWHQKPAITETSSTQSMKHSPWYNRSQGSPKSSPVGLGLSRDQEWSHQLARWEGSTHRGEMGSAAELGETFPQQEKLPSLQQVLKLMLLLTCNETWVSPSPWSSTLVSLSNFFPQQRKRNLLN